VKFCPFVANLYPHMSTNFGRFILILNKMALIFLGILIVLTFQVSSFTKWNCRDFIANDKWSPIHLTSVHWIIRFGAMLESYHKLQPKPKTVPKFEDALQLIWSVLLEKAIDKHRERPPQATAGMCVSRQWIFCTYNLTICITYTNCYI